MPNTETRNAELMQPRDHDMATRYSSGETLDSIGAEYGITRERVRQIVKKLGGAGASEARAKRQKSGLLAQGATRLAFLERFGGIAADLAARGYSRPSVIARLKAVFPDINTAVADDALAGSEIIFDKKSMENRFSDATIIAGLWYLLGSELSLAPDGEWAAANLGDEAFDELPHALEDATISEDDLATILGLIGAAQRHAIDHPEITITGARYQELREELVAAFGLISDKGVSPWPPTRQTVMKRFGGWNEALVEMGISTATKGRSKGLVQFTQEEYDDAVVAFKIHVQANGISPAVANYGPWAQAQTAAGFRRPSVSSMRNLYGSWGEMMRSAPKANPVIASN
jgi:hypothetical protein